MGKTLQGEYYLHIHEMGSAFNFTKDGTFEFYFSYGAIDRTANGTYSIERDTLKLHSDKEPCKDFPITKQDKKGKGYTIKVSDPNTYLLKYIKCMYFVGDVEKEVRTDDQGMVHIDEPHCDKIYLQHELFPDVASLIKDTDNENTNFEVTLSPSLVNVSFKGIDFIIDGNSISCLPNYFMPYDNIRYTKE